MVKLASELSNVNFSNPQVERQTGPEVGGRINTLNPENRLPGTDRAAVQHTEGRFNVPFGSEESIRDSIADLRERLTNVSFTMNGANVSPKALLSELEQSDRFSAQQKKAIVQSLHSVLTSTSMATGMRGPTARAELITSTLSDILHRDDRDGLHQGWFNKKRGNATCTVSSIRDILLQRSPEEYARVIAELGTKGSVTLAGGEVMKLDPNSALKDSGEGWGRTGRTLASRVYQCSMMSFAAEHFGGKHDATKDYSTGGLIQGSHTGLFDLQWQFAYNQALGTGSTRVDVGGLLGTAGDAAVKEMVRSLQENGSPVFVKVALNQSGVHALHARTVLGIDEKTNTVTLYCGMPGSRGGGPGQIRTMSIAEFKKQLVSYIRDDSGKSVNNLTPSSDHTSLNLYGIVNINGVSVYQLHDDGKDPSELEKSKEGESNGLDFGDQDRALEERAPGEKSASTGPKNDGEAQVETTDQARRRRIAQGIWNPLDDDEMFGWG